MKRAKLAYTATEVAERMQVSVQTVRRQAQAGFIPHIRIGASYRFPVATFDRWLDEQATAALAPTEEQALQRLMRGI